MKRVILLCLLGMFMFACGGSKNDPDPTASCKTCADFKSQVEAEAHSLAYPECESLLDPDKDGKFCEGLPTGLTEPCKTCSDFTTQASAKAYAQSNADCGKKLDTDNDGIYCESLPE